MADVLPHMWHRAVRTSPFPVAIADLGTLLVVEANASALRAFEQREGHPIAVDDGISVFERHRDLAGLVRSGRLDGFETHISWETAAAVALGLRVWVRSAAEDDDDGSRRFALVIASEDLPEGELLAPPPQDAPSVVTGTTDREWTISWVTRDATELLGFLPSDLVGTPFLGLVAPDAAADVVAAMDHASGERRSAVVSTRVRNAAGDWRGIRLIVSPAPEAAPGIAFVMAPTRGGLAEVSEVALSIERRIGQIMRDVRLAGLAQSTDWAAIRDRMGDVSTDLSSRQWEILVRLLRGERVPDIARSMHLSPSTVRNHLTAVFRKFGVRSQGELLAKIRAEVDPGGSV